MLTHLKQVLDLSQRFVYQIYQQFPMRYNSLRSQLNWHSKQQTHLFKKLNKVPNQKETQNSIDNNQIEDEMMMKGNELIWLERMMKELHQYKQETNEKKQKPTKEGSGDIADFKEKCVSGHKYTYTTSERQAKVIVGSQQSAKSAKKIRFQILTNTSKPQSAKKSFASEQKVKPKSAKKLPNKATSKKSLPQKQNNSKEISNPTKDIKICCPSNTKVIEMQTIKTDPYSFKETDLKIIQGLWKKQSEDSDKLHEGKTVLSTKKSIGKIIRNSDKLNKTCIQIQQKPVSSLPSKDFSSIREQSSYQQYEDSRYKQSFSINSFESRQIPSQQLKQINHVESIKGKKVGESPKIQKSPEKLASNAAKKKSKYQKIFIKLQTDKLSEYLCEKSQVKPAQEVKDTIIDTNQYQKYCLNSNRIDQSTTAVSVALPYSESKKFPSQNAYREVDSISKKQQVAPRAKSEQRKFNKCAQVIRQTNHFETTQKISQSTFSKEDPFSNTMKMQKIVQQNSNLAQQVRLKRRYDYTNQQIEPKAQKLFTLHSVSSDRSEKQTHPKEIPSLTTPEPDKAALSLVFEEPSIISNHPVVTQQPSIILQQQPSLEIVQSRMKQSNFTQDQASTDPTHELTLLFNFLDEGQRGLLTDTNCQYESLTEELKLLLSAILNQIRTKKRFYNLQKFIQESKDILEIKKEVYINNHSKSASDKSKVYHSLKQNVQKLRKKYPLMFVKHTFTQSCNENNSNFHSKKNSMSNGQSLVIDRVEIQKSIPKKLVEDSQLSNCLQERQVQVPNRASLQSKQTANTISIDTKWSQKSKKDKENSQNIDSLKKIGRKGSDFHGDIDLLQPEIYLQKKYGFSKGPQQGQNIEKMSTILQRTRGYLENLDSYLKMR